MTFSDETIWIIGASSGIGEALAKQLAAENATIILSARSTDKLEQIQKEIGEHHLIFPLDTSDEKAVYTTYEAIMEKVPTLDRVLFMAGIYEPTNIEGIDTAFAQQIMNVNFMGAIYTTQAVLPVFKKQGAGQIVLCASVAGYSGLPNGQPYSASKAALINFAESLHAEVPKNIDVKVINPGFVETPLTDKNDFEMPMCITPDQAATAIIKGLQSKNFEIHFPKKFTYLVKLLTSLPYFLKLKISKKLAEKRLLKETK